MSSETSIVEVVAPVVIYKNEDLSSEEPPMEEWLSLETEVPEENIKRLKYAQGLYDPGSGEICAAYIPMSASSVFRHVYYNYPGILDPGIEEALLKPERLLKHPENGQELYLALCKEMGLCPVRAFYRGLLKEKIDLKYYGVNPLGFRAMAMALKMNRFVKVLDLTDNWINDDGCFHFGDMLNDNITITEINLTGCRIGVSGAKRLFENLPSNQALRTLNLSRNKLGDHGVELLAYAILKGANLINVNLSFNDITGKCLFAVAEAFENNNKLTHFDLSWNSISLTPSGLLELCTQLSTNLSLEYLNLSWNSLSGSRVGNALIMLLKNPAIRQLNLSNNKLGGQAIKSIAVNLSKAKKLETLDLSFNPLTVTDAIRLLERLRERRVKLKRLLLDNVEVDQSFMELRDEILSYEFRTNTFITWGSVKEKFIPKGKDIRDIVFDRCEAICKKKKKPIDIALVIQQMYRDNPEPISTRYFTTIVKDLGVHLDDDLIEEIANRFPGPKSDKTKLINLVAIIDYLKRKWPDRKLPPAPPTEPELILMPTQKQKKNKKKK